MNQPIVVNTVRDTLFDQQLLSALHRKTINEFCRLLDDNVYDPTRTHLTAQNYHLLASVTKVKKFRSFLNEHVEVLVDCMSQPNDNLEYWIVNALVRQHNYRETPIINCILNIEKAYLYWMFKSRDIAAALHCLTSSPPGGRPGKITGDSTGLSQVNAQLLKTVFPNIVQYDLLLNDAQKEEFLQYLKGKDDELNRYLFHLIKYAHQWQYLRFNKEVFSIYLGCAIRNCVTCTELNVALLKLIGSETYLLDALFQKQDQCVIMITQGGHILNRYLLLEMTVTQQEKQLLGLDKKLTQPYLCQLLIDNEFEFALEWLQCTSREQFWEGELCFYLAAEGLSKINHEFLRAILKEKSLYVALSAQRMKLAAAIQKNGNVLTQYLANIIRQAHQRLLPLRLTEGFAYQYFIEFIAESEDAEDITNFMVSQYGLYTDSAGTNPLDRLFSEELAVPENFADKTFETSENESISSSKGLLQ